jgi:hypothetical protein
MNYLKRIREIIEDESLSPHKKVSAIKASLGKPRGPYKVEYKVRDIKAYQTARYKSLRAAGLCTQCAESKARPGKAMCSVCAKKHRVQALARYHHG